MLISSFKAIITTLYLLNFINLTILLYHVWGLLTEARKIVYHLRLIIARKKIDATAFMARKPEQNYFIGRLLGGTLENLEHLREYKCQSYDKITCHKFFS